MFVNIHRSDPGQNSSIPPKWMLMITFACIGLIFSLAAVVFYCLWRFVFMRNPGRKIPAGANLVAPSDGKIIEVFTYNAAQIKIHKGGSRLLGIIRTMTNDVAPHGSVVSIFMSPIDVHYTRSPIAGKIIDVKHTAGMFMSARHFQANLVNEKTEITIKSKAGKIKMIQVAGFLARRVETFCSPNDNVSKGDVVGVIKLGSQVTLVLPDSIKLIIKKGDRVVAGETIIAKTAQSTHWSP